MITPRIIEHAQGSEPWHKHRATSLNASELAAAMGLSAYLSRTAFVRQRATGITAEVDAGTQHRFDMGHQYEATARPWAEEIIGEPLYPVVLAADVDGLPLSVSLDGQTLTGETNFEHKTGRADLLASLENGVIPEQYHPQLEQGLLISGAERCLFMASSGDREAMRFAWYESRPELRAQILPVWRQFLADVAAYVPAPVAEPVRAEPLESLPAVAVRLDGALTVAGNLPSFATALRAFIDRMPARPTTDTDFATVDAGCKALKKAEDALDAAEAGALASITDVEAMRRAVADCRKLARDTRLAAEKLVERRKVEIKEQAVTAARRALDEHVAALNGELAPMRLLPVAADFPGCIKGLRSIASMQDALDTTLAGAKIAADAQARGIRANVATFKAKVGDDATLQALFADLGSLVHKPADDFAAVVGQRISTFEAAEAEKKRKQQAADDAAAAALAQAAAKVTAEQPPQQVLKAEAATPDATDRGPAAIVSPRGGAMGAGQAAAAAPAGVSEPATLNLGAIGMRLGFALTAAFVVETLKVEPAEIVRGVRLFRESDFPRICAALQRHIASVQELQAA